MSSDESIADQVELRGGDGEFRCAVDSRPLSEPPSLRAALHHVRAGRAVIPVGADKRPLLPSWHEYQTRLPSEVEVQKWFGRSPDARLARIGGWQGGAVLDIDDTELAVRIAADRELLTQVPYVLTPRGGLHLYLRESGGSPSGPLVSGVADLKAAGGYWLVPPSTGYDRLNELTEPLDVANAREWSIRLLARFGVAVPPQPTNGSRVPQPVNTAALLAGVSEGQRNSELFRLSCKLRRVDVPRESAERLVLEAAAQCNPPLPASEALKCVHSAYSRYPAGNLQPDFPPIKTSLGSEVVEVGGDELAAGGVETEALPSLPLLGCEGRIIEGWSHVVAGYPRAGKTELLVRLVREWLTEGRRVLYITEEPQSMWTVRLASLAGDWSALRVVFGLGADPQDLQARAFNGEEEVIVVDTLRNLLCLRDEKDNSEVARVINPWVAGARRVNKTLVMAHHIRKGAGEHGEGIAGGHALLGAFDIAIELAWESSHDSRRRLRWRSRLISPSDLLYERLEDGEFQALGDPGALRLDEVKQRVLKVLTDGWQKTREVSEALHTPKPGQEQVRQALLALASEGEVERDPPVTEADVQGKTVRWRRTTSPPTPPSIGGK